MKIYFLFAISFILLFSIKIFPQEKIPVQVEYSVGNITITYELKGDIDAIYNIIFKLKRSSVPDFEYTPKSLQGDFGEGKFAGGKRKIIWTWDSTEEKILSEGEDYIYEVTANLVEKDGMASWIYWAGGAVVVGVVAALLIIKKPAPTPTVY